MTLILRQANPAKSIFRRQDCISVSSSFCGVVRHFNTETSSSSPSSTTFESIYGDLEKLLNTTKYVKATSVNKLFYKSTSLDQLEQAKTILARFRKSPSHARDSQSTVVVRRCVDLGLPDEAIEIAMNQVKYGIFPRRKACETLLISYVDRLDVEGIEKTMEVMRRNEIQFNGIEHYFMAKVLLRKLCGKGGCKEEVKEAQESGEGRSGDSEEEKDDGDTVKEEELAFKHLRPVLDMCLESYKHSSHFYGPKAIDFVHKQLLDKELNHLSSEMLEFLEDDGRLSDGVMLMLHMDKCLAANHFSGVLSLLGAVQDRKIQLPVARLKDLAESFDTSGDDELRQRFHELNLD